MPVIKRYPNRKLYDTAAKQYVSLDGIAELIRSGAEVQVVDYTTGEDLTALILMQVIVEQEKKQSGFLPQSVLAGLVQAGGDTVAAVRRALEIPLDLMRQVDEEIEQRIQSLVRAGELREEEGIHLRDKLVGLSNRLASAGWSGEASVQRALSDHGVPTRTQLQSLSDQLDVLEAELDAMSRSGPPNQA
ncbi:MAG: pesticidal protein Cry15Aa [Anaerolineae bacterium]|jgi:polyhydroxyalkanoate synthesis repressor PhaR|nr:pesticidal protein Cry15Aa [Anaerolineae bacterium]